jgi:hypothetical protein
VLCRFSYFAVVLQSPYIGTIASTQRLGWRDSILTLSVGAAAIQMYRLGASWVCQGDIAGRRYRPAHLPELRGSSFNKKRRICSTARPIPCEYDYGPHSRFLLHSDLRWF